MVTYQDIGHQTSSNHEIYDFNVYHIESKINTHESQITDQRSHINIRAPVGASIG